MNEIIASSFADLADVAAFHKWYKIYLDQGKSPAEATQLAFAKGDNGVGFTGLLCATEAECLCALPPEDWKAKWRTKAMASGKPLIVTHKGIEVRGRLGDTMPAVSRIRNGARIDLNPGFAKAFGLKPPFLIPGFSWRWADA